jgi:hypothetical protein
LDTIGDPNIFPPTFGKIRILTYEGLEALLRLNPRLVPDLAEVEVQDESKANGFAETLVCIQAVWFCFQIVVRIATHLTISILELNTLAHALCTLFIYFMWWDKPLDITEPTIICGETTQSAAALLSFFNKDDWCQATALLEKKKARDLARGVVSNTRSKEILQLSAHRLPSMARHSVSPESRGLYDARFPLLPEYTRFELYQSIHGSLLNGRDLIYHWDRVQPRKVFGFLIREKFITQFRFFDLSVGFMHCLEVAQGAHSQLQTCGIYRSRYIVDRANDFLLMKDLLSERKTM